ncbi:unnamed protein product [Thelazia callipaeda]|uniref:Lysosomal acid phosphatase n=1 Tax=Thelazia callipaeda TaxID=103827 RepID=A0A0N5CU13_THECL|nr:unnamed protein product [Thelazia callipaeda]
MEYMFLLLGLYNLLISCVSSNPVTLNTTDSLQSDVKLIYVQAIWRHGDRAPHQLPYPNDLNDEKSWPRGWSHLTNVGMKQIYDLGRFFQQRYHNYVNEFNSIDVKVVTSRSERAIVSAQAMLRGFFPIENSSLQWLKDEKWQPIPFYMEKIEKNAPLLHSTTHFCPRYNALMQAEDESNSNMMQEYANFTHFLANITGIGENLNFSRLGSLLDIQREIYHNLPQPAWVHQIWPQYQNMSTIEIITKFKLTSQILKYNTIEKAKLKGGLLLGEILDRFKNVSSNKATEARKMYLYSAHDATVCALQYALNVGQNSLVPYAACLILELYQSEKNETVVKILYKNETESDYAHELQVPGCSVPCTLNQLIILTSSTTLHTIKDLNKVTIAMSFSQKQADFIH